MSSRFFLVVAAYSFDDILTIAELGKYLIERSFRILSTSSVSLEDAFGEFPHVMLTKCASLFNIVIGPSLIDERCQALFVVRCFGFLIFFTY